ncbi:MAG: hypothetical protein KA143_01070 [Saprospiraceae bacterium]|nr:hypothetical protein [Saprospiraceae bacterium]
MEEKNLHSEIQNELKNISPRLADVLRNRHKENVPPGYFDQMQEKVLSSLTDEKMSREKIVPIQSRSNWKIFLMAASVLGVILLSTFLFQNKSIVNGYDLAMLNEDEIKTYLLDHAYELDDDHLSQLPSAQSDIDLLELSDDELKPVLEDYLYQIENTELN